MGYGIWDILDIDIGGKDKQDKGQGKGDSR